MESLPLQDDLATMGIRCCISNLPDTVLPSPLEIEYESKEQNDGVIQTKPPARRARLAARMPPNLRRSSKGILSSFTGSLTTSFTKSPKIICDNIHENSHQPHHHDGGRADIVSSSDAAKFVAAEYFAEQGPDPELLTMPTLLDENEGDYGDGDSMKNDLNKDKEDNVTTCSESHLSVKSFEDVLALEVGISANSYLEECFYAEVSVLNREKFNAIPEIIKSNFTITGHLGKGSYSDVFAVVCKDGQLGVQEIGSNATPGRLNRIRSTRGRISSLSSSFTTATLSRLSQRDERRPSYAMKCLRPQIRSDADQFTIGAEDLVHETAMLASLDHNNIIKVHGRATGRLTDAFVLNDGYFILLDRLNETLQERIAVWKQSPKCDQQGLFRVSQMKIAHSIADAMTYLHSKNIAFRDLKPANVGFDSKGVLKLFDFGFAIGLPETNNDSDGLSSGLLYDKCGTPRYMASEVGLSRGYGLPADVYSFGILLWEIYALETPFSFINSSDEFDEVVFMGGMRPHIQTPWPMSMKVIMSSCWTDAPSERPTMLDVKSTLSYAMANNTDEKKAPGTLARRVRSTRRRNLSVVF